MDSTKLSMSAQLIKTVQKWHYIGQYQFFMPTLYLGHSWLVPAIPASPILPYLSVSSSIFQYLSGSFLIGTSHSGFPNPSLSFSTFQYFAVSFSTVLGRSRSLPAVLAFPIFPYFSVPCSICQTFPYLSILTHTFLDRSFPPRLFPVLLGIPNYS